MKLLIKSAAGLVFLWMGLGIALVIRHFYLWRQDLVGPYAQPTADGVVWLVHQTGLMLVMLVAAAGTLAKRQWGGDALAVAWIYSVLSVCYNLLWVDTHFLVGRTPDAGYTAGLLVVYAVIGYVLLKKNAPAYYGLTLNALRVSVWVAASMGLLLFNLYL